MLSSLIIYIEDSEDDVFFFSRGLAQARHSGTFKHLASLQQARDYFRDLEETPAMILVDLHIGPDSGKELIQFLRSIPALQKVPIVTLSGSYVYDDLDKAYETGANLFLVKPTDLRGWTEMIFRLRDYFPPERD